MNAPTNGHANGHAQGSPPAPPLRMPPYNLEAERDVIAGCLQDPAVLADVITLVRAEDFFRESHQVLYAALRDLFADGRPITPILLGEELERRGRFAELGGHPALIDLLAAVPHAANAAYHAQVVRQKALTRRLITILEANLRHAYTPEFTFDQLHGQVASALLELHSSGSVRRLVPVAEAVPRVLARLEARAAGEFFGLTTGLADLDYLTCGLQPEQLIILAARPSMGKTTFATGLVEHACLALGRAALYVSLEMGEDELVERMIVARGRLPGHHARAGYLSTADFARARAVGAELAGAALHFDSTPAQTLLQVLATARGLALRHAVDLVVLDYIQLAEPEPGRGREGRQEQVASISRGLKALARELKVPVVALSQLNRLVETRPDRRPRMSDLRESGAIEQDADLVLLLHRPEYYDPHDQPGVAELIVAKNRNGATGTVQLRFSKESMRFDMLHPDAGAAAPDF